MPISNYPNGFRYGVSIRGVPLAVTHPGQVFWVGNSTVLSPGARGASDGNDGTYNAPFATLEYALSRCVASRGDLIFIKPGHAESIANATTLTFDKAGVAVVGLGQGSLRPTFTFTTANTANIPVTAGNITIHNCLFVANFAAIASVFTLTAAPEFVVDGCEFRDTSSILNFVTIVTTVVSTNNDGLVFTNNNVFGLGTTAATTPIKIAATHNRLTISDNRITLAVLNNTSALLAHGALVVSNLLMQNNRVYRPNTDTATGGILITTTATTNTGLVCDNFVRALDAAAALLMPTGTSYGAFNNYYTGEADLSGFLLPAAASDA
jgi:hypothetical protein